MMTRRRLIGKIVQWLLLAAALVLLVTGLGITEYGIVEKLSFGLLTKSLSLKIHTTPALWILFVLLLATHISLPFIGRKKN
jgi:hypothetical protein